MSDDGRESDPHEPPAWLALRPADETLGLIELYYEGGVEAWQNHTREFPPSPAAILMLAMLARKGFEAEAARVGVPFGEVVRTVRLQAMDAADNARGPDAT